MNASASDFLVSPEALIRRRTPDRERPVVDVAALERTLQETVRGEVRFDDGSRAIYAQDASNYRRIPLAVVLPASQEDAVAAIAACRAHGAPIVARGGGTALAGQTVNEAVVLDFSKYVNRVVEIDPVRRRARVEPGVVCDDLVHAARPLGLTFGPKPATHNHCCFGGMLANNCGGRQAQWNGIAVHNVESLEVVLYDGTRLSLGWTTDAEVDARIEARIGAGDREAAVLRGLRRLRDRYAARIAAGYPVLPRRVSGYNLDQLIPDERGRYNLARVIVGSEGTLATILEAEVILLEEPKVHGLVVLAFPDVFHAGDAVPDLLDFHPLSVEGVDDRLCEQITKKGGEHAENIKLFPEGNSFLVVEIGGESKDEVEGRLHDVVKRIGRRATASKLFLDPSDQSKIWDAREGGLGATAMIPGEPDSWPGWEDSAVPVSKLGAYLRDLRALYDRYDFHPALYGHFGQGLIHCRVPFNLWDDPGVKQFQRFMNDAADLVVSYRGSLSGEHGDGQSRAALLEKMFGPELMGAMRELKAIFDPDWKMNPGKIVDPYPIDDHLRQWPDYSPAIPETHFRYPEDGGMFSRATLRCVGVGKCRRGDAEGTHDVMCPSYMVTHEEKHSTRGRAHLLWEMVRTDGPIARGWQDEAVKEALDLCLACKGCKVDCPVNVDVATYKAEFLSHYYERRLRPRHAYAFGYVDVALRLAELAPDLANFVTQTPILGRLAKLAAGIGGDAEIPALARTTFRSAWARRAKQPRKPRSDRRVVLWPDTFSDHFHPDTAMAAALALENAGYEVDLPRRRVCCGRPLYDFGMLDRAKQYLERTLRVLAPEIEAGTPIVVLEPSCASVFKDELVNLFPDRDDARRLHDQVRLFSDVAAEMSLEGIHAGKALVQGHCHQKAVAGMKTEEKALRALGLDVEVLTAGCCGMAGSFGFVEETRPVGKACGERKLAPRLRAEAENTIVVADGFSCREQIRQLTGRTALHVAEVVAGERADTVAARRARERRISIRRGGALAGVLAFGLASLVLAAGLFRRSR